MSMKVEKWECKLLLVSLFMSLLYVGFSEDFPSQGCYWTHTCLHKWQGDCGGLVYNQSSNCFGHCQGPKYSPCPAHHTHFYCCIAGSPTKVNNGCRKCEEKVEDGDQFVCCSDCTYPEMIYGDTSSGYCKTGAQLISEPKRKVFRWVASPWLPCSAPCAGGIRSGRVECFAVIEDTSSPDYPVYDNHCLNEEKPSEREPCNLQSCIADILSKDTGDKRHDRKSKWMITIFISLGIVAIFVLGFVGFSFYKRRTSNQPDYVYIMMRIHSTCKTLFTP